MLAATDDAVASDARAEEAAANVAAARRGDRAAAHRLHTAFAPMVHGIALARAPRGEAHDLVQETFLHALDRLGLLRDDRAFGPWLAAIARNLSAEAHRRRRLRSHAELAESLAAEPVPATPEAERAAELLDVIRALPDAYAETLILRLVEGLTGPQIAASTGMTHGSVRVNLTRGMHMLRERLNELGIRPEESP